MVPQQEGIREEKNARTGDHWESRCKGRSGLGLAHISTLPKAGSSAGTLKGTELLQDMSTQSAQVKDKLPTLIDFGVQKGQGAERNAGHPLRIKNGTTHWRLFSKICGTENVRICSTAIRNAFMILFTICVRRAGLSAG